MTAYVSPDEPGKTLPEREYSNTSHGIATVGAFFVLVGRYLLVE